MSLRESGKPMLDGLLERIQFVPPAEKLADIPWPHDLAPKVLDAGSDELPHADVLVVTYTAAEAQALGNVLSPGHPSSAWQRYTENWAEYESQLTSKSPARGSKCLGTWAHIQIGGKTVVLLKSDLHMSTDAQSLPIRQLFQQLVGVVEPELVITTGTAGGIGVAVDLGDVLIANAAKFNCEDAFKDETWAQDRYPCPSAPVSGPNLDLAFAELITKNAGKLKPQAKQDPQLVSGAVETLDFFGFADPQDTFGVGANDPDARMDEMDDAVLPLALEGIQGAGADTLWLPIRNTSDPQTPKLESVAAERDWANSLYRKYGYWTSIGSAITCWAVIADMAGVGTPA